MSGGAADRRVSILYPLKRSSDCGEFDHPQIILIQKPPITVFAVILVMASQSHVHIRCCFSVEFQAAGFAGHSRLPVVQGIHVLVASVLGTEVTRAALAFECRCPMTGVIHVLVASTLGTECTRTGLAFRPVIAAIHVILAVILVPEGSRTGLAFIHLGRANDGMTMALIIFLKVERLTSPLSMTSEATEEIAVTISFSVAGYLVRIGDVKAGKQTKVSVRWLVQWKCSS